MTQSKTKSELVIEHEDSAADALRYWVNSTTMTLGANFSINMLLQAMKQVIEQVARPDQIERVETVITEQLNESYDYVRAKSPSESSDIEKLQDEMEEKLSSDENETLSYMAPTSGKKILN